MSAASIYRLLLFVAISLVLFGLVGANIRPFAYGDMRIFTWIAVNAILLVVGLALAIGTLVVRLIRGKHPRP